MTTTFTPSGTPSTVPITCPATNGTMPTVDSGNVDTMLLATEHCWIAFAPGVQVGPAAPSSFELQAGIPVLLTNNTNLPAANRVTVGDRSASTATACSVMGMITGGTITVTRGTAVATTTF